MKTIVLKFKDISGKIRLVKLSNPKENLTADEVRNIMQKMIDTHVLKYLDSTVLLPVGAYYTDSTKFFIFADKVEEGHKK